MLSLRIFRFSNLATKSLINTVKNVRFNSINSTVYFNSHNNLVNYKLPEKINGLKGIIGDEKVEKLPILDFKRTNFVLLDSINSSVIYQPTTLNEVDTSIFNILSVLINENNLKGDYELPTHRNYENEKRTDYYKHKDRKRFTHLLWIRHRKMKKHQRIKWRKKNLAMIKRKRLVRNISTEKLFRAELLAQIQQAENFDPKAYVENILHTIDNVPKTETPQQKYQRYLDLIRKNRTQTNLTMPKFED